VGVRILYLCADFGIPVRGFKGASVHVREATEALVRLGHEVTILTPNVGEGNDVSAQLIHVPAPLLAPGVETALRAAGRPWDRGKQLAREMRELAYNRTLRLAAAAFSSRWTPDCIYERYALFGLAGAGLAAHLGVPHLLEVNAPLRLERQRAAGLALDWPARWSERRIFGRAHRVLCVSESMAAYVRERIARRDRVLVQPNAVDAERFRPEDRADDLRAQLGFSPEQVVVGFVGSLKPWHGVEHLVEAVARARTDAPQLRLLIVGDGPARTAIERALVDRQLESVATLAGNVAHARIPEYLAAMDITVAPYLEAPNFYFSPLKVFEYMAAGRPVIASRLGQIPEILRDGETGLLYPPGDIGALAAYLRMLTARPEERRALGTRAAEVVRAQHTWMAVAKRIEAIIHEERARLAGHCE
jgi:glycosyltransferase involved in cell wall biosynthesis